MNSLHLPRNLLSSIAIAGLALLKPCAYCNSPIQDWKPIFNAEDTKGWRGGGTFDHWRFTQLDEARQRALVEKWNESFLAINPKTQRPYWRVENGELISDGQGAYATTIATFRNFEFVAEYRISSNADSGVYLRGIPQIQIWDVLQQDHDPERRGSAKGSGGLWNNTPGSPGRYPATVADRPPGQWNRLEARIIGSRVSVRLNGTLVVADAILENSHDYLPTGRIDALLTKLHLRSKRPSRPAAPIGPIQLQTHGGEVRWRNLAVREIHDSEAISVLQHGFDENHTPAFAFTKALGPAVYAFAYKYRSLRQGKHVIAIRPPPENQLASKPISIEITCRDYRFGETNVQSEILTVDAREFQFPTPSWNFATIFVHRNGYSVEINGAPIKFSSHIQQNIAGVYLIHISKTPNTEIESISSIQIR